MTNKKERLLEIFTELSNTDVAVNFNTKIDDLELDSLETLDLLMMLENEFKQEIAIDKFAACADINAVYDVLEAK